jgi:predicted nucleic acid-binding Zn ribbon protein
MRCEQCGHELPHITAMLAQTEVGTQCPNCWTRLRRLVGDRGYQRVERQQSAMESKRAS